MFSTLRVFPRWRSTASLLIALGALAVPATAGAATSTPALPQAVVAASMTAHSNDIVIHAPSFSYVCPREVDEDGDDGDIIPGAVVQFDGGYYYDCDTGSFVIPGT